MKPSKGATPSPGHPGDTFHDLSRKTCPHCYISLRAKPGHAKTSRKRSKLAKAAGPRNPIWSKQVPRLPCVLSFALVGTLGPIIAAFQQLLNDSLGDGRADTQALLEPAFRPSQRARKEFPHEQQARSSKAGALQRVCSAKKLPQAAMFKASSIEKLASFCVKPFQQRIDPFK